MLTIIIEQPYLTQQNFGESKKRSNKTNYTLISPQIHLTAFP